MQENKMIKHKGMKVMRNTQIVIVGSIWNYFMLYYQEKNYGKL